MSKIPIYADNDFGGVVYLEKIDPATGLPAPLLGADGAVQGFITLSRSSDAPAIVGLDVVVTALTVGNWTYFTDASDLPRAGLAALNTDALFLVIKKANDLRWVFDLKLILDRKGT